MTLSYVRPSQRSIKLWERRLINQTVRSKRKGDLGERTNEALGKGKSYYRLGKRYVGAFHFKVRFLRALSRRALDLNLRRSL
jgi:hypothetical protein